MVSLHSIYFDDTSLSRAEIDTVFLHDIKLMTTPYTLPRVFLHRLRRILFTFFLTSSLTVEQNYSKSVLMLPTINPELEFQSRKRSCCSKLHVISIRLTMEVHGYNNWIMSL